MYVVQIIMFVKRLNKIIMEGDGFTHHNPLLR